MAHEASRPVGVAYAVCSMVVVACAFALAATAALPAAPVSQAPQSAQPVPPLVLDAVVVDNKGALVEDMRASDFTVMVDGKPRVGVAVARLFRGPGAAVLAAARQATAPGEMQPRAESSRAVIFAVDQGSFLPGDERRARLITESCLGLLGLNDRVMFLTLPDLAGSKALTADRDPFRQGLGKIRAMRAQYADMAETLLAGGQKPADPVEPPDERLGGDPGRTEVVGGVASVRPDNLTRIEDLLPGGTSSSTETLSPPAAKAHALAMLAGLRQLLEALRSVPGPKTVFLLSAGLIADDASRDLQEAITVAESSFTRIYAIQVPTPTARFTDTGRAGLLGLARATGGSLVTLTDKPAQALQRMASELSFSYLLMLAPVASDFDRPLQGVSVRTRRGGITIRTSAAIGPGRLPPEPAVSPPDPPVTAPAEGTPPAKGAVSSPVAVSSKRPVRRDPALDAVLIRVAEYADFYGRELSAVVAEEVYEQKVTRAANVISVGAAQQPSSRRLVSDYLLVKAPGLDGWLPFRDVFEVDGVQVRDRDDRLKKLFLEAPPQKAVENGNQIFAESARYNLGGVRRNINVPTLPLVFVNRTVMPRFEFSKRGEPTEGGVRAWEIDYREVSRPTFIKTPSGGNVESSGTLWVEPVSGRILRSVLKAAGATITVTYQPRKEVPGLWLPVTMQESYVYNTTRIQATATYSKFRRFQVFTEEHIKPPKAP